MIDIRDHGGNFGGGKSLKPIGKEIFLEANGTINKGEFVGLFSEPNQTLNPPTFLNSQPPFNYVTSTSDLTHSYFQEITSEAGHTIMLRGRNSMGNYITYVLKPYYDVAGKLSAINYPFSFVGMIYSVTKLNSNTFVIFRSNSSIDTTGVTATIIRIDDVTGEPIRVRDIVLFTDAFYKTFIYIPFNANILTGIIIYTKGANSVGYSDSTTAYYRTLTLSSDFSTMTPSSTANTIKYLAGEPYGYYTNIRYSNDLTKAFFCTQNGDYSLQWNGGTPILTTIKATGVTVKYDSLKTFLWSTTGGYSIAFESTSNIFKYAHDKNTNAVTSTNMGGGTYSYGNIFRQLIATVDWDYMTKDVKILNPQAKNIIKPVGSNAFMTVGTNPSTATQIYPIVYYFSADMSSILGVVRSAGVIMNLGQYIDGNVYVDIDDDLRVEIFATAYAYYDGQGSFRYPYSVVSNLDVVLSPIKVSSETSIIHGIALDNAVQGNIVKCIIGDTANTDFILGGS